MYYWWFCNFILKILIVYVCVRLIIIYVKNNYLCQRGKKYNWKFWAKKPIRSLSIYYQSFSTIFLFFVFCPMFVLSGRNKTFIYLYSFALLNILIEYILVPTGYGTSNCNKIIILYIELGFSCTIRADFIVDAHRSPLAAHIQATSRRMLVNNARDASPQERLNSKMTL